MLHTTKTLGILDFSSTYLVARARAAVLCARHLQVLHDALLVMPLLVMPSAFPCAA